MLLRRTRMASMKCSPRSASTDSRLVKPTGVNGFNPAGFTDGGSSSLTTLPGLSRTTIRGTGAYNPEGRVVRRLCVSRGDRVTIKCAKRNQRERGRFLRLQVAIDSGVTAESCLGALPIGREEMLDLRFDQLTPVPKRREGQLCIRIRVWLVLGEPRH